MGKGTRGEELEVVRGKAEVNINTGTQAPWDGRLGSLENGKEVEKLKREGSEVKEKKQKAKKKK